LEPKSSGALEVNSPVGIDLTVALTLQHKAELFAEDLARGDHNRVRKSQTPNVHTWSGERLHSQM
jgi:hypothetical protein